MKGLSQSLISAIEESLRPLFGSNLKVEDFKPVGGGCINNGGQLITNKNTFFVKYNDDRYAGMFETEAKGLQALQKADAIRIPAVYATGSTNDNTIFIVLEWIETGIKRRDFWDTFGEQLAQMHKVSNTTFGLDFHNYIGSLPQYNKQHTDWPAFFQEERIEKQIAIGKQNGKLNDKVIKDLRSLYPKLDAIFPEEPPALLHGDLWGGNFMVGPEGQPVLIDPAVYYGHREMELAFTTMFGGFSGQFYEAYNHLYPLAKGFNERKALYNLYPVMVHVNLFGGPYLDDLKQIIKQFQ